MFHLQNAARLMRGLFEMALHKGWPTMAYRLLGLCKMLDKRLWDFENPLRQFTILNHETLVKLQDKKATVARLRDMTADEIGTVSPVQGSIYSIPTPPSLLTNVALISLTRGFT